MIKATRRIYRQDYVLILRAVGVKIAFLREYSIRYARAKRWTCRFLGSKRPTGRAESERNHPPP